MNYLYTTLLLIIVLISQGLSQVWIEGHCFLENQVDHSATQIIFEALSPSAVSDTTYTGVEGLYQINLSEGIYNLYYNHEEYLSDELLGLSLFSSPSLQNITLLEKYKGIYLSGQISGVLIDTVYIVENNIEVIDSLTILPGAIFYFDENCFFDVLAPLTAIGSMNDSIKFLSNRNVDKWGRLWIGDNSIFKYCVVEDCADGIECDDVNKSTTIENCYIRRNGWGIKAFQSHRVTVKNCIIKECNTGIESSLSEIPLEVSNCTIIENHGLGISISYGDAIITNSIFENNHGAIGFPPDSGFSALISFSDFYNNTGGDFFSILPPSLGELILVNNNGDSCDAYYNIFEDPLFKDAVNKDFSLQRDSPCIDAGDPNLPQDPDGTISDIGTFYYHQGPHPEITLSDQALDFGEIEINSSSSINLGILNSGDLNLIINDISIDGDDFTTNWNPSDSIITPGASLNISVSFFPLQYTQYYATLYITNNDHNRAVSLSGVGVPPPGEYPTSLIVTGGGADSLNWEYFINNTNPSTNDTYTKLAYGRYYEDIRLFYMNPIDLQDLGPDSLDDGLIDQTIITAQTFHDALLGLYDSPDEYFPNVLFLAGHGHVGEFDINGNLEDNIKIDTLSLWLDEANLDQATPLVVIFEACFSGSYMSDITASNRIIITACRDDQFADYLDGESFSTHFWHEIWYGNNVWDAFSFAYDWSMANLNGQEPLLDADGNGVPNEESDRIIASSVYLGGRYVHGAGLPKIVNYPENLQLIAGQVDVWAECNNIMDRVWFRIFPIDYTGVPPIQELPYNEMLHSGNGRYESTFIDDGYINTDLNYNIQIQGVDDIFNYAVPRIIPLEIISTGISKSKNVPDTYYLSNAFPNPFNPSTKIIFTLPKPEEVKIEIYNTLGQKVEILLNQQMKSGNHEVEFNAKNFSSGVYFYRIEAGKFNDIKKMVLIK